MSTGLQDMNDVGMVERLPTTELTRKAHYVACVM